MGTDKKRHEYLAAVDTVPWLPYEAILFLDSIIEHDWKIFEWGAGASTFWLAQRCEKIFSIETEEKWTDIVKALIKKYGFDNIDLKCIPPEDDPSLPTDFRKPNSYRNDKGLCHEKYVKEILRHPDQSFDLVYVDGRARPSCLIACLPKVRTGGYILLDNTDHKKYWMAMKMMPEIYQRWDIHGYGRKDPTNPAMEPVIGETLMKWKATIWRRED